MKQRLFLWLYDVKLPNTMTEIEDNAFQNCAISEIDLPSSLTSIGALAFCNTPLSSIIFPSSLKITPCGDKCFYGVIYFFFGFLFQ